MNYEIVVTSKVVDIMMNDYHMTNNAFCKTYHAYFNRGRIVFGEAKYYDLFMLKYSHLI